MFPNSSVRNRGASHPKVKISHLCFLCAPSSIFIRKHSGHAINCPSPWQSLYEEKARDGFLAQPCLSLSFYYSWEASVYPGLSNNSGAQWEPYCLSRKAKRGPPKVYQSGLRLLWGTGDFKGQIPVPVCIRHQDKVTTSTVAGPWFLFRWDGPDSHQYLL